MQSCAEMRRAGRAALLSSDYGSEGFFCISMTPSNTVVGGLIVFAAIITAALIRQPRAVAEDQVTHRPIQLEEDGYVSSQTCKTCHPSQYQSWHSSYHRTMTQVATPQSARADFEQCAWSRYRRWADVARAARPGVVGGIRQS